MPIPLRCQCGKARGAVNLAPASALHLMCYCSDCRAFAHALARGDILDNAGGSEVVIARPSQLTLTAGLDQLRCMRLSSKGMLRWYWACCNTPLANSTPQAGLPFVSLHRTCLEIDNSAFPTPPIRVQARAATGPVPAPAEQTTSPGTLLKIVGFLIGGVLRRAHKPSPLFVDGKPVVEPTVLSTAERNALREMDGAK